MTDLATSLAICVRLAQAAARTPEQSGAVRDAWDIVSGAGWLNEVPANDGGADPGTALTAFVRTDLSPLREVLILAGRAARSLDAARILSAFTEAAGPKADSGMWLDPRGAATRTVRSAAASLRANAELILAGEERGLSGYEGP